ncbi:MAG: peptidylprolyl isomerase [Candidatus Marinimicrobia bacterium]|nr:peptidylprolyl isomerase [Candidatus Neomarinimicrobiota bacterium]MDP7095026.1 peptidylprolyl isomerase [Candidatus Neomarinimicrobiota bacterium]MDP7512152.1 peptidylprolyl isomerase [Candidatus Neomarinimicrobiota bacterium]
MKQLTLVLIGLLLMNACTKEEDVAVISTRFGDMVLEFYPDVAPKHVESFKIHAQNEYFNGTTFHRIIPGFVIQGGDPNSRDDDKMNDGQGGHAAKYYGFGDEALDTSWTIPAEFNDRPHITGALSMARTPDENSAGSQFFICAAAVNRLDNQYTVFGQVISGLEVIQQIVNTPRDNRDNPKEKIAMEVSIIPRSKALEE